MAHLSSCPRAHISLPLKLGTGHWGRHHPHKPITEIRCGRRWAKESCSKVGMPTG
eukprot:CAMPEP_0172438342 /NCGR_PEP_ID=MMETSP1064-20121228/72748_1 /TAXON_ID=202472 /ORGANISM="Aulacoseira subarctica , Strain CCAP 1002/5" /LENGTH=54 /DNA_ID=CAMNT_0013186893 /DNA_START=1756 /DNA_END=1920 /DNA_ORIENTATION=-